MKNKIKEAIFGKTGIHSIRFGIAKRIKMRIDPSSKAQRILGLDEYEIAPCFKQYSENSNVFIDIGASDGFYGLIYKKHNPKGKIFLFDAQEVFNKEQRENFELNDFYDKNVHLISKFVSNIDDEKHVSIDNLIVENNISTSDILMLKIDVDGGEMEVLKGLKNTLVNYKCKIIIETHSKDLEIGCLKFLNDLNYRTKIIDNGALRVVIPETRPIEHNRWFSASNI